MDWDGQEISGQGYAKNTFGSNNNIGAGSQIPAFETRSDGRENLVRFSFLASSLSFKFINPFIIDLNSFQCVDLNLLL